MFRRSVATMLGACLLVCLATGTTYADLKAFVGSDEVELKDGTRIPCLVLMESARGVLIILRDPEKGEDAYRQQFIPSDQIARVNRGNKQGDTRTFQTDMELARKVIQGSGYRPAQEAKPVEPVIPTGPIAPVAAPAATKPVSSPPATGTGALPAKDLADAYLQRFPELEAASEQLLGGRNQLTQELEKAMTDPTFRQEAERMLSLFLQVAPPEKPIHEPARPRTTKPAPKAAKPAPATGK